MREKRERERVDLCFFTPKTFLFFPSFLSFVVLMHAFSSLEHPHSCTRTLSHLPQQSLSHRKQARVRACMCACVRECVCVSCSYTEHVNEDRQI